MEADPVVEVTYLTQTGYVCSEGFTDHDATVVCRQLGYSFAGKFKASALGKNLFVLYFLFETFSVKRAINAPAKSIDLYAVHTG